MVGHTHSPPGRGRAPPCGHADYPLQARDEYDPAGSIRCIRACPPSSIGPLVPRCVVFGPWNRWRGAAANTRITYVESGISQGGASPRPVAASCSHSAVTADSFRRLRATGTRKMSWLLSIPVDVSSGGELVVVMEASEPGKARPYRDVRRGRPLSVRVRSMPGAIAKLTHLSSHGALGRQAPSSPAPLAQRDPLSLPRRPAGPAVVQTG